MGAYIAEEKRRWAKEDPELLDLYEQVERNCSVGEEVKIYRIVSGLNEEEFAKVLGMEDLERLECGDLWESVEETKKWVKRL